ncbi:hypothetical protein ASPSYDRAFT_1136647 [Aspergillus sydowii CBS 593.65]|uniref:Uncharacterized protein n=1 Tax=Aspergillus sydowii CBS 593.65 TaxID=1036612 RepID=A0A1L9TAC3_9EURO|nr:uncharacterized protein ASPSYDRAFT_1136647 [Aspergillus sydowii CBS 593.65]OJJ56390.1 hypothetical protein ASPSYDRAFT_1136647 [Aspergillus sydowii CBS 593.65]
MTNEEGVTNGDATTSNTAEPLKDRTERLMSELREAVMRFEPEKVKRLLVHDKCPIDRTIIKDAAVVYYNKAVFEVLASQLSKQRQVLLKLAREYLSSEQLFQLRIHHEKRNLNAQAASVAVALIASNAADYETVRLLVPDIIFPSSATSLYFLVGCNRDAAHILYNTGFMNVDELDHLMYSPLAALTIPKLTGYAGEYRVDTAARASFNYVKICTWFQAKQALLHRVFGLAQGTPLYYVAGELGKAFAALYEEQPVKNPEETTESPSYQFAMDFAMLIQPYISNSPIIREIMHDTSHRDQFSCPCSAEGSLPLNVLLNEIIINHFLVNKIKTAVVISKLVGAFLFSQQPTVYLDHLEHVASTVLRACSFASLGLAHTCRSASTSRLAVMLTERRNTHDELDNLVSAYEARFQQSNKSLAIFLITDWAMDMDALPVAKKLS